MIVRRSVLAGVGAAMAAPGAFAAPDPIPATPEAALRGFMRMFAGVSGACVFTNEGVIYGRAPEELARPLFGFLSAVEIRPEEIEPNVFRSVQKEAMVYLDLETRMPLKSWANTYTGETLTPVGYVSPDNVYFFDVTGSYARKLPLERKGRKQLDWRTSATDIWVTERRQNVFPTGITAEEFPKAYATPERRSVDILTYRARTRDFLNVRQPFLPSRLTMVTDGPWPLWMMMGARPGGVIWHGFGDKYRHWEEIPAINRAAIEAAYPGFLQDPFGFPAAEWGTAAQLRRLKAQGKL